MQDRERVLVFCSREMCYLSGNFFAGQLAGAFEELGLYAEVCELSPGDDLDEKLEPHVGQTYRAILDFNSMLPRMEMEDGAPYLEKLNGPFFDYILDHPLFHYNGLSKHIKNLRVITIDLAQQVYVQQYYKAVTKSYMLPLGSTEALGTAGKEAECRVFFPGTYDRPESVYELVEQASEPLRSIMKELIARRVEDPLLPMEEAFRLELARRGSEPGIAETPEQFALCMNAMYPVDAYIRDYFRKKVLDELLERGIPVTVAGNGWEKYETPYESCLKREREMPFALSFERIARSHILLNVSPIFNRGMHDRIPAGMANRVAVLTDKNPYLEGRMADGKEICLYDLKEPYAAADRAEELLTHPALREEITEAAYAVFKGGHTWRHRAGQILHWATEELAFPV